MAIFTHYRLLWRDMSLAVWNFRI